jgi:hypothetical protein
MLKLFVSLGLILGVSLAADPYFGIKAYEPGDGDLSSVYNNIWGVATAGLRFPRSSHFALNADISGTYVQGAGDFSNLSLWNTSLRLGAEFNTGSSLGAYITPGLMLTYAAERMPSYDTVLGYVGNQTASGAGLGVYFNAGLPLFRIGDWDFDAQFNADLVSVPTNLMLSYYGYGYYGRYSIDLSGISLGLVARKGVHDAGHGW